MLVSALCRRPGGNCLVGRKAVALPYLRERRSILRMGHCQQ
jgi:hypothetical protein